VRKGVFKVHMRVRGNGGGLNERNRVWKSTLQQWKSFKNMKVKWFWKIQRIESMYGWLQSMWIKIQSDKQAKNIVLFTYNLRVLCSEENLEMFNILPYL